MTSWFGNDVIFFFHVLCSALRDCQDSVTMTILRNMTVCIEESSCNLLLGQIVVGLGIKNKFLLKSVFLYIYVEIEEGGGGGGGLFC